MSQDPTYIAKNDAINELAPEAAAPQKNKLDLGKLELIRRWSLYAAALVLVIFVALFVGGIIKLNEISARISEGKVTLQRQTNLIEENNRKIKSQDETIKGQDETITVLLNPDQQLNPEQAKQVQQTVERNIVQTGSEKKIAARIYIQIGDEDQRKRASEAVRQLQKKGYIVPGIENVGGKGKIPLVSQLRYFQTDSVAQEDIKDIVSTLSGLGINLKVPKNPLTSTGVRTRQYEIWFGQDF